MPVLDLPGHAALREAQRRRGCRGSWLDRRAGRALQGAGPRPLQGAAHGLERRHSAQGVPAGGGTGLASSISCRAYHLVCGDPGDVLFETDYAYRFVWQSLAATSSACSSIPKSYWSGAQLLRGFLAL